MANLFDVTVMEGFTNRGTARIKTDNAGFGPWFVWEWLTGDWYDTMVADSLDMNGMMLRVDHQFYIPFCPTAIATASSPMPTTLMHLRFIGGGGPGGAGNYPAEIDWRGNLINTSNHFVTVQLTLSA